MVMYLGQNGDKQYIPPEEIGRPDGQSEVTISGKNHEFEAVMIGDMHGWRCTICGYREFAAFFGKTPECKGAR